MNRFAKNWDLKLLSLAAAIFLWFFVVGIENTVYLVPEEIEVKVLNMGNNIGLASKLPAVKVYVKAGQDIVKTLNKNSLTAYVDLSGFSAGEYSIPVRVNSENSQVVPLETVPENIDVILAPVSQKEVPIVVASLGNPKEGYTLKEIRTESKNAVISGTQNILDTIASVKAEVTLAGTETAQVNKEIVLEVKGADGAILGNVEINPGQITVTAVIEASPVEKTVKVIPQFLETGISASVIDSVSVSPQEIKVSGDAALLANISEVKTRTVSVNELQRRSSPMEVVIVLPDGVSLSDPFQKTTLSVDKSESGEKTVAAKVLITRDSSSFRVKTITPTEISVTLSGPPSALENISAGDIYVNLDIYSVVKAGKAAITSKDIAAPQGIEVLDFEPKEVTLEAV